MTTVKLRIAILISGGGTTMAQTLLACQLGILPGVEVVCVIASKPTAGGIQKALDLGMSPDDVIVRRPKDYPSPEAFGEALLVELRARRVQCVMQMGWLPITPANVIQAFLGWIFNQHPGSLRSHHRDFGGPGMYGKRVHAARLEFVRTTLRNPWTEVVCHRVTEALDQGVVIRVARVPIMVGDTADTLQQRALPVEHLVQIAALIDISSGQVTEVVLYDDLVHPGEEDLLAAAKADAVQQYPNG